MSDEKPISLLDRAIEAFEEQEYELCGSVNMASVARSELAALRATIAQQQKRIEAGERVAEEFAKVEHNIVCEAGQYGVVEPCTCDLAPLAKALDAFRKSALTKAFTELSSTVDAIRTKEMEQSAMTKIADESGNDPPIGVEP